MNHVTGFCPTTICNYRRTFSIDLVLLLNVSHFVRARNFHLGWLLLWGWIFLVVSWVCNVSAVGMGVITMQRTVGVLRWRAYWLMVLLVKSYHWKSFLQLLLLREPELHLILAFCFISENHGFKMGRFLGF